MNKEIHYDIFGEWQFYRDGSKIPSLFDVPFGDFEC